MLYREHILHVIQLQHCMFSSLARKLLNCLTDFEFNQS